MYKLDNAYGIHLIKIAYSGIKLQNQNYGCP